MASRAKSLSRFRNVLLDRAFTEEQVEKVLARLPSTAIDNPDQTAKTIDTWNRLMDTPFGQMPNRVNESEIPKLAAPPKSSKIPVRPLNLNTILADIEPDLLLFDSDKLINRHKSILGIGVINNSNDLWTSLFNAPRGLYLQDWSELMKKIYYIEQYLVDLLYDKKEQKTIERHPIVSNAAVTEVSFDHLRTRYLFASRSGYLTLAHMYKIQSALERPTLCDLVLSSNQQFLGKFAPFCTSEEYDSFSNLIKRHTLDEDDAQVISQLAELSATSHGQF